MGTASITNNNKVTIVLSFSDNQRNNKRRRTNNNNNNNNNNFGIWPKDRPEHLHFNLYKVNRDNMDAIMQISKAFGLKPKTLCIAGTKDKRGITVQKVSACKFHAEQMAQTNDMNIHEIKVGNFSYSNERLNLGKFTSVSER